MANGGGKKGKTDTCGIPGKLFGKIREFLIIFFLVFYKNFEKFESGV